MAEQLQGDELKKMQAEAAAGGLGAVTTQGAYATAPVQAPGTSLTDIQKQVATEGRTATSMLERPGQANTALEEENRKKLFASGELSATDSPDAVTSKINMATYGVEKPIFGAVDSSSAAGGNVDETM